MEPAGLGATGGCAGTPGAAGTQGRPGPKGDPGPADWGDIAHKPADFADGVDNVGSVGYYSGIQVTRTTPLAVNAEETWYATNWSSSVQVLWSVIPITTGDGTEKLLLTVRSERAANGTITYRLTVRNDGHVPSAYEPRYVALDSGIAVAKKASPKWL